MSYFDEQRAIAILGIEMPKNNCERIEIDYPKLKALRLLGLVRGYEAQNNSPSVDEFLEFCETNNVTGKEVIFEAYIVTNREDARVIVEGIRLNPILTSNEVKKNFIKSFHHADEFEAYDENYRAWWD